MDLRRIPTLPAVGALTLAYFVAGKLALKLAFIHASASPVWPPAGIALAALVVLGYRIWPAIFIGAFLVNITTYGNVFTSLCIGAGNTLEALCGAWLVNCFANGTRVFDRSQDVFKFAVVAATSTLISPTLGVTSLALSGFAEWAKYGAVWLTWWLGDTAGILIAAPLVVLWCVAPTRRWTRADIVEVVSLLLLVFLLGQTVFGGWLPISAKTYPIAFLCGPVVVWTAFRFTQRETATAIFILSAMAIWGTLNKVGPFIMETENQSLLILQAAMAALTITALPLSAGMAQRRRAEAAIEEQKAVVEAASRAKDNFLAMLSHELRTPLTPVMAVLDTLEMEAGHTAQTKASLAMIRRNVELERQLIDDLLDLTRIAKDKLDLRFEVVDAHNAISNVVELCRPEAAAKQLQLHVNLRATAHHISADPAKFQQIVWNLVKNAIKFTGQNGDITIASENPTPELLKIAVIDTGVGLEPEIMERMFDPFEQGDRSFQRRFGGLGLGLAISKSLAEAHGGTLTAMSAGANRGATFVLTMKTVALRETILPPAVAAPPARRSLRILLVDDHEDTRSALERLLGRRGHLVATSRDLRSAMQAAVTNQFDLLISDVALPDGTGMELIAYLRAMSPIPGIAISGFGMNGDVEKSLQAGFSAHLVKPVSLEELEAAIERVMTNAPSAR